MCVCRVDSPESAAASVRRLGGETLPASEKKRKKSQVCLSVEATDGRPVWSCQCLCFQGSQLMIDGCCHVLSRSIFLPPPRMWRLDCKQTCCWVTAYTGRPRHFVSALIGCSETLFCRWKMLVGALWAESGRLTVKDKTSSRVLHDIIATHESAVVNIQ